MAAAKKPNLFATASKKAEEKKPAKPKGTVIELPKELDDQGQLTGDSLVLNQAITEVQEAKREEKAAKNKGNLAKGVLNPYVLREYARRFAIGGVVPATPVSVVNYKGESLTYVVQDKSQQNPVDQDQINELREILGEEAADNLIVSKTVYSFNNEVMVQKAAAGEEGETVEDVVFSIVSDAIMKNQKLSDEQKESIISAVSKTFIRQNTLQRLVEICGADANRIQEVLGAAGSAWVRYLL